MDTVSRMYTYARSLAWPEHWLKEAARAYDVAPDAVIDDMVWAGPIKDAVRRILEEDAHLYDGVLYHLRQREAFAPACDTFVAEQAALRQAAQARSWNDLSRFVRAIDFPRLKSLRKLSDDDKAVWERCKKVRDDVKKDVIKTLQSVYFSATPEEWLDGMRAMKPVMDGLVTLTLDFAGTKDKRVQKKMAIHSNRIESVSYAAKNGHLIVTMRLKAGLAYDINALKNPVRVFVDVMPS